jgi:hypothetical protein
VPTHLGFDGSQGFGYNLEPKLHGPANKNKSTIDGIASSSNSSSTTKLLVAAIPANNVDALAFLPLALMANALDDMHIRLLQQNQS